MHICLGQSGRQVAKRYGKFLSRNKVAHDLPLRLRAAMEDDHTLEMLFVKDNTRMLMYITLQHGGGDNVEVYGPVIVQRSNIPPVE